MVTISMKFLTISHYPFLSLSFYSFLCFYEETIARIPYFSYVSMLHLYESFGWFRAVELRKVHAAEGKKDTSIGSS